MSDIFNEIDEDLRRDRMNALWAKYWPHVLSMALLVVVTVGGWRYYDHQESAAAAAMGTRYEAALKLAREGKAQEADVALAAIATQAPAGYKMLARFRAAGELAERDAPSAVRIYDEIAADAAVDAVLRDLAKVRAGYLLVDTAPVADLSKRLDSLTQAGQPWRNAAREILGLSAFRNGDNAQAERFFGAIQIDADAPAGTRARADFMLNLLAGQSPKG